MSAPQEGYGQYSGQAPQYGEQAQYPDQGQGYEAAVSPPPSAAGPVDHGKKKKRAYAAQAFEVGQGGNVAGGAAPLVGSVGQYGATQPVVPGYGGYPGQDAQTAAYGGAPQPAYGMPQPGAPVGGAVGYQAPEPYYPSGIPPAGPGMASGMAGITQGMAGVQLGAGVGAQQGQAIPGQAPKVALNQLYPTDLMNQPFNVSELDLPPPPIILPPNVSIVPDVTCSLPLLTYDYSPASRLRQTRTAHRSTFVRH